MIKGIDTSKHQASRVDYEQAKRSGYDFAIIRVGINKTKDECFEKDYASAVKAGLKVGAYYATFSTDDSGTIEDAKCVVEWLQGRHLDLPVALDVEKEQQKGTTRRSANSSMYNAFAKVIKENGYKCMLYTGEFFFNSYFDKDAISDSLWIAKYSSNQPNVGKPISIWQYTSNAFEDDFYKDKLDRNYVLEESFMSSKKLASAVISIAMNEVGYLEKKSNSQLDDKTANAGSANYTKYGRDMHELYPSVMDFPAAWCDAFVDWCFYKAYGTSNAKGLIGGDFNDYTPSSAQLYKNKGAYYKSNPKIGDQIFFRNSQRICHTGLVYDVRDGKVFTIEGNTSGASGVIANGGGVCMKSYALSDGYIDGYGRPKYDDEELKSTEEVAKEVINGKWGTGVDRKNRLAQAGYNVYEVQTKVNELLGATKYYNKYTGTSTKVDVVFVKIGVPEQYIGKASKRKPIATANGISLYVGTASQNLKLVSLAKEGKLKKV